MLAYWHSCSPARLLSQICFHLCELQPQPECLHKVVKISTAGPDLHPARIPNGKRCSFSNCFNKILCRILNGSDFGLFPYLISIYVLIILPLFHVLEGSALQNAVSSTRLLLSIRTNRISYSSFRSQLKCHFISVNFSDSVVHATSLHVI